MITSASTILLAAGGLIMLISIAVDIGSHHKVRGAVGWILAGGIAVLLGTLIRFVAVVNWAGKITLGVLLLTVAVAYLLGRRKR